MEGSESEAVFESLNLNPQIVINETLNTVDDLLDDAFQFYQQEASSLLKVNEDSEKSQFINQGIAQIRNMVQSNLDMRLGMWEKYCLHHCFAVPEGFLLPETKESLDDSLMCQDVLLDPDVDQQLETLRNKLNMVEKESAELNHELQALQRQSSASNRSAALVDEVLELYEQSHAHDTLQEMVKMTSELQQKLEKLKARRMEDAKSTRTKDICNAKGNLTALNREGGLSSVKVEELKGFLADLANI